VPRYTAYGEISWKSSVHGFETAVELRATDRIFVNDINSESADAYTVASWRAGFEQRSRHWSLKQFVRIDNLFDRQYIGSVIVNESNARYYEPAPGRNYLLGAQAAYRF